MFLLAFLGCVIVGSIHVNWMAWLALAIGGVGDMYFGVQQAKKGMKNDSDPPDSPDSGLA